MTGPNWDRRRFLRMASMGAMAGAGLATNGSAATTPTSPQVLIIGAGMAGVATAFWLRQFGISSIILEGRNRIGGRIDTSVYWPDVPLDLGASFIHDAPHSPLYPLTKLFGIDTSIADLSFKMYGVQNQPIPLLGCPPSVASMFVDFGIAFALVDEIRKSLQSSGAPDQPLGNVVNRVLNSLAPWNPEELAGVQTIIDQTKRLHYSGVELRVCSLSPPLPCTQGRGVGGEGWFLAGFSPPHPNPSPPEYRRRGDFRNRL